MANDMSDIVFTMSVNNTLCSELEAIRKMNEVRDYSGLLACVERIQQHGNAMERGLFRNRDMAYDILKAVENEMFLNKELADIIINLITKRYPNIRKDYGN